MRGWVDGNFRFMIPNMQINNGVAGELSDVICVRYLLLFTEVLKNLKYSQYEFSTSGKFCLIQFLAST